MKRYNKVNNALGWLCFVISAITYLLTIEPTASFWDCPEFISQGAKLEVGHPPGNPIFMLTARFFVTIFGGDITKASIAVNSMSALLSAATILLLFWTITHLVRRILVRDSDDEISTRKLALIMGAGLCGALAYTWSDTFWFSAVEGEVYAFSSFCTALVFWLILKWENHADEPHSDRYLVLIAYVIGVSIAVHLLNLLCIPAIVLVFYYRTTKEATAKGSLKALALSFILVALILFGLVPGFVKVAQGFELFFVNVCHMGYNSGTLIYAIVLMAVFVLTIRHLYARDVNQVATKLLIMAVFVLSGLTLITSSVVIWVCVTIAVAIWLMVYFRPIPVRTFTCVVVSIFVIFIGYSSYALLLIRASADTPMNQNNPDNVFTLSSYLNREQYGKTPLLYGPVFSEELMMQDVQDQQGNRVAIVPVDNKGIPMTKATDGLLRTPEGAAIDNGSASYSKVAKSSPDQPDEYVKEAYTPDYQTAPDLKMLFTRMYSSDPTHVEGYKAWSGYTNPDLEYLDQRVPPQKLQEWADRRYVTMQELYPYIHNQKGVRIYTDSYEPNIFVWKPTIADNIRYFLNYQLNHMYWRYFMWNFAGRQNDIQGNGEIHQGNWISGIPFIDNNLRGLGDQSMLPDEFGAGNKGHNVFYMLPLLLGIIGLLWQSLYPHKNNPKRGIEQFWVVFFLFFMTGIAIVLYLNQTPGQPRERDYAFAGSFYAFAIWIGMGVPAISVLLNALLDKGGKKDLSPTTKTATAVVALAAGILVPLQMVSQTWDDHDRSHRYTTRDFGENYLNSLDANAIIFTNGDNDTFPLWYAQEVEGVRPDVRVVNLSYLSTDWYANQLQNPYYDADAVPMLAKPTDYAYDKLAYSLTRDNGSLTPTPALDALKDFYDSRPREYSSTWSIKELNNPNMVIPVDSAAVYSAFAIDPQSADSITKIPYISDIPVKTFTGGFGLNKLLSFDIVANSFNDGFKRPVYFATTVPSSYYLGMEDNLWMTGLAYQVTPFLGASVSPMADKAYENIVSKFRWGGLDDTAHNKNLYLDETVRRMVTTVRSSMIETASELFEQGELPATEFAVQWAKDNSLPVPQNRFDMARYMLNLVEEKLPEEATIYEHYSLMLLAELYMKLYIETGNEADYEHARAIIDSALGRYSQYVRWGLSMSPAQRTNLGSSTESSMRYNIMLYLAYDNILELAKAMLADNEITDVEISRLNYMINPQYRSLIYPYVFAKGMTADDLNRLAESYDESDFYAGSLMAEMFDNAGINRTESTQAKAMQLGLSLPEIIQLNPYVQ